MFAGGGVRKSYIILLILALSIFVPYASSATSFSQSGLGLSGFLAGIDSSDDSITVDYSDDGVFLAAGFRTGIRIFSVQSGEVVKEIVTNDRVEKIRFSSDSNWVIAGLKSFHSSQNSIVVLSKANDWEISDSSTGGQDVTAIAISNDNSLVAMKDTNTGIIEYDNPGFTNTTKYDGVHTASVTCLSYDDTATFLLSGDGDGRLVKWVQGTSQIDNEWTFPSAVSDCAFDPNEGRIAALSSSGELRIYSNSGGLLLTDYLASATTIQWSADGTRFYVLQDIGSPHIIAYATGSWDIVDATAIGHAALDFSMHPDNKLLAIASDATHVVLYSSDYSPEGFGLPGTDTDKDGIPNDIDLDDDGDGIPDMFDHGENCPNNDCSLDANIELIRQIGIEITSDSLIISDKVLYSAEISSALRLVTAETIDGTAETITAPEVDRVAQALCDNIREEDVFYAWESSISIEGVDFSEPSFACYATSGLFGISKSDELTRISMTWVTTFTLSNPPSLPYNVSFNGIIPHVAGSAAQIAPLTPINLQLSMEGAKPNSVPTWNNDSGSITLLMENKDLSQPTAADEIILFAKKYFVVLVLLSFIIVGSSLVLVRKRNAFDFDFDHDEEESGQMGRPSDEFEQEGGVGSEGGHSEAWTADSGIAPPMPNKGPPSKRQRLSRLQSSENHSPHNSTPYRQPKQGRRRKPSTAGAVNKTTGTLEAVAALQSNDAPTNWDYEWDGAYDDSKEEYDYSPIIAELPTKVRKVKHNLDESDEVSVRKVAKKRKKVTRKKSSGSKTSGKSRKKVVKSKVSTAKSKSTTSQSKKDKTEEEMMSSALDMLTNNEDS